MADFQNQKVPVIFKTRFRRYSKQCATDLQGFPVTDAQSHGGAHVHNQAPPVFKTSAHDFQNRAGDFQNQILDFQNQTRNLGITCAVLVWSGPSFTDGLCPNGWGGPFTLGIFGGCHVGNLFKHFGWTAWVGLLGGKAHARNLISNVNETETKTR